MIVEKPPRRLIWVDAAKKEFVSFPKSVQREFGFALRQAQNWKSPPNSKHMKGALRDISEKESANAV